MTQEDKELLLKDLCARLPYGVIVNVKGFDYDYNDKLTQIYKGVGCSIQVTTNMPYDIEQVKPYLFPLSSMTEEQILAFWKIEFKDNGGYENDWDFPLYPPKVGNHFIIEALDWLNRNHFDYRGLIEKGLAIDATGLNVY